MTMASPLGTGNGTNKQRSVRRAEEGESIEQLYAHQKKLNHDLKDGSENAAVKERLEAIEAEIKKREEAKEKQRLDENSSE